MWDNQALALGTDGLATDGRAWQHGAELWRRTGGIGKFYIGELSTKYCQSGFLIKLFLIQGLWQARR